MYNQNGAKIIYRQRRFDFPLGCPPFHLPLSSACHRQWVQAASKLRLMARILSRHRSARSMAISARSLGALLLLRFPSLRSPAPPPGFLFFAVDDSAKKKKSSTSRSQGER